MKCAPRDSWSWSTIRSFAVPQNALDYFGSPSLHCWLRATPKVALSPATSIARPPFLILFGRDPTQVSTLSPMARIRQSLDGFPAKPYASFRSQHNPGGSLMKLLTAELRAQLPPLYSQEKNEDPTVHAKFF